MSKVFVKKDDLKIEGVYLVANGKPVFHQEFVEAQIKANYIIHFAEAAKGKDFVGKAADSLYSVKQEVSAKLNNSKKEYVTAPTVTKGELHTKLEKEALAWVNSIEKAGNSSKVNDFLQQFNIINKFESVGLYFEEEVCELEKVYTIEEIVEAVKQVIDLLD